MEESFWLMVHLGWRMKKVSDDSADIIAALLPFHAVYVILKKIVVVGHIRF